MRIDPGLCGDTASNPPDCHNQPHRVQYEKRDRLSGINGPCCGSLSTYSSTIHEQLWIRFEYVSHSTTEPSYIIES
jgi:hypothetical protein